MAANVTRANVSKPSFASIAAMAPPRSGPRLVGRENQRPSLPSPTRSGKPPPIESPSASQLHHELQQSMLRLDVKECSPPVNILNDQQKTNISRAGLRVDDDHTQASSSSTKPASVDGKSTTSGTTFALDEKESLRPDDSASVKAAEDEDFGSGPASGAPNSRVGSEAGSRAFRDQFYEITENIGPSPHRMHPLGRRVIPGIEEESPQLSRAPLVSVMPAPISLPPPQLVAQNGAPMQYQYQEPDEKLFEALESPKDRLFLLRLEQSVITFVRDSTEAMIDLPPCNSFCRLLAHKLADYYALTHFVDNAVSSVRLYRTPYCRLPDPLSSLASRSPPVIDGTPLSLPAMKIMRRAGLGKSSQNADSGANTAEASTVPSKSGSENGDDSHLGTGVASPTDSTLAKDKTAMSREEREAKYKETRERIFGPESENVDGHELGIGVSRTSSKNEKKKRKHKNHDDGFEARSQFTACYPSVQYPPATFDQNVGAPAYYNPYALQSSGQMSQNLGMDPPVMNQNYQQGYAAISIGQNYASSMNGNQSLDYDAQNNSVYAQNQQQMLPQYYPQMQQNFGIIPQSSTMSSPALSSNGQFPRPQSQISDQQWQQNGYQYPYQQSRDPQQYFASQLQAPNTTPYIQQAPYPYGQLPMQGMPGAKSQHPLPGSYKSQSFNPQTRAFVPTGGSMPQPLIYQGAIPNQAMLQTSPVPPQNGFQYPPYGQQTLQYPHKPSMPIPLSSNFNQESKTSSSRKVSSQAHTSQPPAPSSLSKWGTPAHLPPKPPPPEVPSFPEGQHSLPTNNHFNATVQTSFAGQPMPSFHNGVYTIPGASSQAT